MCELKSGLVLKDRIYVPDHDYHSNMLEELKIEDTQANAETKFVRFELLPPCGDVFAPIEQWELNVDQDIRPDWFFEELELPKIRAAVKVWADKHIFEGVDDLELPTGNTYWLKNCKAATLRENSTATLWENSTATLWGNSTATLWGNSTGIMPASNYCQANRENYILMDNSTLKDCSSKVIYQSGDWKFAVVEPQEAEDEKPD